MKHKPKLKLKRKKFATVSWQALDIMIVKSGWSVAKCEKWLAENERNIASCMCSAGWDYINTVLP